MLDGNLVNTDGGITPGYIGAKSLNIDLHAVDVWGCLRWMGLLMNCTKSEISPFCLGV